MENVEERRVAMIAQAKGTIAEARYREAMARKVTNCVAGALAYGLREQGLTDKAIGEVLTISRNRVADLVKEGIWPYLGPLGDQRQQRHVAAEVDEIYQPVAHPSSGWTHTLTDVSGRIAHANGITLPKPYRRNAGGLDTAAAQFDNLDTGERILVYSLERHHGQILFDSEMRLAGYDFKGHYRIDLCSPAGTRQPYPLEILGITCSDLRFGKKWSVEERRHDDDAFRTAVAAVRRHYGIWPLAAMIDDYPVPAD